MAKEVPAEHVTQTRNIFAALVLSGHLTEKEYDDSIPSHHRYGSGIINLIKKHEDKLEPHRESIYAELAGILAEKPEGAVEQLKILRGKVSRLGRNIARDLSNLRRFRRFWIAHFRNCSPKTGIFGKLWTYSKSVSRRIRLRLNEHSLQQSNRSSKENPQHPRYHHITQ